MFFALLDEIKAGAILNENKCFIFFEYCLEALLDENKTLKFFDNNVEKFIEKKHPNFFWYCPKK